MELEVRNYIRKEKNNIDKGKSISNFSRVKTEEFYKYLAKVISIFENKPYCIETILVNNEQQDSRQIWQTVLYNQNKISDYHFHNIKTIGTLRYVISEMKDYKDMLVIPTEEEIPLLNEKMEVNINWNLLHAFPYLPEIILDLINHKYNMEFENKEINYRYLEDNILSNYQEMITNRHNFLTDETIKKEKNIELINKELNSIISFIQSTKLNEGIQKSLIYDVKKLIRK